MDIQHLLIPATPKHPDSEAIRRPIRVLPDSQYDQKRMDAHAFDLCFSNRPSVERPIPNRTSCWMAADWWSMDSSFPVGGATFLCFCSQTAGIITQKTWCSLTELLWYPRRVSSPVQCPCRCNLWIAMLIIVIATAVHRFGLCQVNVL